MQWSRMSRATAVILAVPALAVLATLPTWTSLARVWIESDTYSHGFLSVALALVFLVQRAAELDPASPRGTFRAWPALAAATVLWLVAYRAHSAIGHQLVAPVVILAAFWMVNGARHAVNVAPAIAFLYFAVPVWSFLTPLLQSAATAVVGAAMFSAGIPAYIEGNFVHLAAGNFEIAEGCSGLRYFIVALAMAATLALFRRMRLSQTAAYLATSAALAVVCNWLRIITIILVGHASNMQHYLVRVEHQTFGWLLFASVLVLIAWLGWRISTQRHAPATRAAAAQSANRRMATRLGAVATLSLIPAALAVVDRARLAAPPSGAVLPELASGWRGPVSAASVWQPRFVGASLRLQGTYSSDAERVEVFVAEYASQAPGNELFFFANSLANANWTTIEASRFGRASADPRLRTMRRDLLEAPDGTRWVVGYSYQVADWTTGFAALAQLAYGVASWTGEKPVRVVAVAYRCRDLCDRADSVIDTFLVAAGDVPTFRE